MTDKLIHVVSSFLKTHKSDRPLLIGFSGGPDSLALLHTLLSLKENIAIAHVDHGWREESGEEHFQDKESYRKRPGNIFQAVFDNDKRGSSGPPEFEHYFRAG